MSRKWRIVFALVTVAAVACAILFFVPKELSALISPGADEFSISSAIVEVSGEMSGDAVTITDAAALSALGASDPHGQGDLCWPIRLHRIGRDHLIQRLSNRPKREQTLLFQRGRQRAVYLEGKEYRLTDGCRDAFVCFCSGFGSGGGAA